MFLVKRRQFSASSICIEHLSACVTLYTNWVAGRITRAICREHLCWHSWDYTKQRMYVYIVDVHIKSFTYAHWRSIRHSWWGSLRNWNAKNDWTKDDAWIRCRQFKVSSNAQLRTNEEKKPNSWRTNLIWSWCMVFMRLSISPSSFSAFSLALSPQITSLHKLPRQVFSAVIYNPNCEQAHEL